MRRFEQAREFVHGLNLQSHKEWIKFCKSGNKPHDIPHNPDREYKNKGWINWGDWLGTNTVAAKNRKYLPFKQAREFMHSLKLKNQKQFRAYLKSDNRRLDIPSAPERVYKKEWKDMNDWLGTDISAYINREFWSFEKAREYVRKLGLKTIAQWRRYCRSGKKPTFIPSNPEKKYRSNGWINYGDWLGTEKVANRDREFLPFKEAREYVRKLGLKTVREWEEYRKSGRLPQYIPTTPQRTYKDKGWINWGDWLGTLSKATQQIGWSIKKVKELIKDLIENKVIYEWTEDERYHLLLAKGVLNLRSRNRFSQLLEDLVIGPKTEEQRKALEDFANSDDDENIPDIGNEKIPTLSTEKLAELEEEEGHTDPLDGENIQTPQQILSQTEYLESICQDIELMQFFVNTFVNKLWKNAFRDKKEGTTVNEIRQEGKTSKKFHDTVRETFLSAYDAMESIEIPKGYSFRYRPTLMQRYVASKVKTDSCFGNFSGTGAGKTLSAILASRVIDSKMTLVVCPNDVVDQWASKETVSIPAIFPDSKVITGKPAFYAKYDENKHQYLVLNYDKFSQYDSGDLIQNLVREKIDFAVLDEIHFIKKRDEEQESKRREKLGFLLTEVRKKNTQVKVLGMSATPVINRLREGISLLEYMTGKVYEDLADTQTVPNAMALYQKLSTMSIREMPEYKSEVVEHFGEAYAERPKNITAKHLKRNPLLIEQILTDARIPEIIKRIEGQTIIYTEYVTEIVDKLKKAVADAGYIFAEYTGDNKEINRFIDKKVQVLIASRPISVGVDGLQDVCHNLIINTLPWTNAQYKQLIGRLHRFGQKSKVVNVHIIKASIAGYAYDESKWIRIEFKRTLADCAVDGRYPKSLLQSKEQMQMELIKWLERLERNEISIFERRNLNVILTPSQKLEYIRKTSEFTRLNQQINSEYSQTTHERIERDPQLLVDYHRKLDETKKGWDIHPVNVIAKKINDLKLPAHIIMKLVIGDFGCGKGELMELLKENKMYSFDHHNIVNEKIIPCDMKSVSEYVNDGSLDVAIFSLSLMGKNWSDYIKEASRCIAKNGLLFIAETTKSLSARLSELRNVIKEHGFQIYEDEEIGDFTFIEARKL